MAEQHKGAREAAAGAGEAGELIEGADAWDMQNASRRVWKRQEDTEGQHRAGGEAFRLHALRRLGGVTRLRGALRTAASLRVHAHGRV